MYNYKVRINKDKAWRGGEPTRYMITYEGKTSYVLNDTASFYSTVELTDEEVLAKFGKDDIIEIVK